MFTKYVRKEDIDKVLATKNLMILITIDNYEMPAPYFANICSIPAGSIKADEVSDYLQKAYPSALEVVHNKGFSEDDFEALSITFWESCPLSPDQTPVQWHMFRIDVATLNVFDKDHIHFFMNYKKKDISEDPYEYFKTSVYVYHDSKNNPQF